jgi:hypothetical protein
LNRGLGWEFKANEANKIEKNTIEKYDIKNWNEISNSLPGLLIMKKSEYPITVVG